MSIVNNFKTLDKCVCSLGASLVEGGKTVLASIWSSDTAKSTGVVHFDGKSSVICFSLNSACLGPDVLTTDLRPIRPVVANDSTTEFC